MKRHHLLIPALASVIVFGATACTASEAPEAASTGTSETAAYDWDVAFASCMRDAGIDYADPEPDGGNAGPTRVDDQDAFDAASHKCTTDVTAARGERPVSADERATRDKWNGAYSETIDCLRKKGYDVEELDGGFQVKDQVPDAEFAACAPEGQQKVEGQ